MSIGGTPLPLQLLRDVQKTDAFTIPGGGEFVYDAEVTTPGAATVVLSQVIRPGGNGAVGFSVGVIAAGPGGTLWANWTTAFFGWVSSGVAVSPFPAAAPNQTSGLGASRIQITATGANFNVSLQPNVASVLRWGIVINWTPVLL